MNPLDPWVALLEMLILLGLAFLLGRTVAWLQYRRRMRTQERTIKQLQQEINASARTNE